MIEKDAALGTCRRRVWETKPTEYAVKSHPSAFLGFIYRHKIGPCKISGQSLDFSAFV
jgi:hypothetical protein